MPIHSFIYEETGETIDVYVPINSAPSEHQFQITDGKTYKRIYSAPLAATNTRINEASKEDFARLTTDKKGLKVGQMWEMAAEMSQHRSDKNGGVDEVKESFYNNYKKEMGKPHPDADKRERIARANEQLKAMGVKIEL